MATRLNLHCHRLAFKMSSIAHQCTTLLRAPSLKTAISELHWAVLVHDFIIFVHLN